MVLQIAGLKMCRTEQLENGEWIEDPDQVLQLKANFIISAFGSGLYDSDGKCTLVNTQYPQIAPKKGPIET